MAEDRALSYLYVTLTADSFELIFPEADFSHGLQYSGIPLLNIVLKIYIKTEHSLETAVQKTRKTKLSGQQGRMARDSVS
jgi:hypothetical protein